ncbi:MAG: D-glycero-beta-D-manno-heptose-7-phosphate kinase [Planctomycetota bacterium]
MNDSAARQALAGHVPELAGRRVLVVGDVMLDHYVWGSVERISPEAPVPVLQVEKESEVPGGAANVARNVAALGGRTVLLGLVGRDARGARLAEHCADEGVDARFVSDARPTTAKMRCIARNQQLLRTDWEEASPATQAAEERLLEILSAALAECEIVVVSDYAKGVVTPAVAEALRKGGRRVVVDPKPGHRALYKGFHLMTPNQKEAAAIAETDPRESPPIRAAERIAREYTENVLVTCGAGGIFLRTRAGLLEHIPARARQVYDVTGAGDTVAAVVGLALAAGLDLRAAAELANHAAGIVVGKVGTATVSPEELRRDILDRA